MTEAHLTDAEPPKPVSPFELFFDLVFVFSLTRVTSLVLGHPDVAGVGRGLLVLALLWWAWGAYAWLTNAVNIDTASSRAVILGAMAAMLIVAVAVPQASGRNALPFALGYFVVRLLHLVLFSVAGGANRAAILRLAPGNLAASVLLIIGVFTPTAVQMGLWALAVMIDYGTPLITGVGGFTVHAGHFFERHTLFMIIALGESVIAIGAGVLHSSASITPIVAGSIVLALAAISGLWWSYFDWEAGVTERVLSSSMGPRRAHLARDLFSYLHLPLVAGVVFAAVGVESVTSHPMDPLHGVHALGLGGGVGIFLLGLSAVCGRRGHRPRVDHLIGGLLSLATIPASTVLPGLLTLAFLVVILLFIAFVDRAHGRSEVGERTEPVGVPVPR
ncbi:low temperature requirement protein A [Micromonospora sp. NPDC048999]|uniref:low temperature requirement protein A n=1 Tax=Micromonospora sp. NPDC048999 TaxID=3155391 RepID=UPI0033D685EF